jgi:hypothetical protein
MEPQNSVQNCRRSNKPRVIYVSQTQGKYEDLEQSIRYKATKTQGKRGYS